MAEIITYSTSSYDNWDDNTNAITANLYTVLSAHDNRFSYTSGTNVIGVSNKFKLVCSASISSYVGTCTIYVTDFNDTSTALATYTYQYIGYNTRARGWTCRLIKTDNTFYLEFIPTNPSGGDYTRLGAVIAIYNYDNKTYFGMYGSSVDTAIPYSTRYIENLSSVCIDTQVSGYQIKKIANYSLNATDLFFTPICVAVNSAGGFFTVDDFCSSSNLTFKNTIATNNKNYYAIGTNTLIELSE